MGSEKYDLFLRDHLLALQTVAGLAPLRGTPIGLAESRGSLRCDEPAIALADTGLVSLNGDYSLDVGVASSAQELGEVPDGPSTRKSKRTVAAKDGKSPKRRSDPVDPGFAEKNESTEPKRALTVKEATRTYSISRSSLYLLIKSGALPDVVVGGRRLLPRDAMEKLIAGKCS